MKKLFLMAAIGLSLFAVASTTTSRSEVPNVNGYAATDTIPGPKKDTSRLPVPDSSRRVPPASVNN